MSDGEGARAWSCGKGCCEREMSVGAVNYVVRYFVVVECLSAGE